MGAQSLANLSQYLVDMPPDLRQGKQTSDLAPDPRLGEQVWGLAVLPERARRLGEPKIGTFPGNALLYAFNRLPAEKHDFVVFRSEMS